MAFLHRIAEWRAYLPRGSPHAKDIVADAFLAMLNGAIVCTPAAVGAELQREVRRRAEAYQRTVERSTEIPLDDAPASALVSESADEGQDAPIRDAPDVVNQIRSLASADAPVLHLLELRLRGLDRRRDAWSIGMTPNVYRGARERLAVYAARAVAASASAKESTPFVIELDDEALRCE